MQPDPYNEIRIERGRAVAERYHKDFGDGDRESAYVDLLADLMHAIHADGINLDAVLLKASSHFYTESGLYEEDGTGRVTPLTDSQLESIRKSGKCGAASVTSELVATSEVVKWKTVWQQKPHDSHSRMVHEFAASEDRDTAMDVAHLEIQRIYCCQTFTIHSIERVST